MKFSEIEKIRMSKHYCNSIKNRHMRTHHIKNASGGSYLYALSCAIVIKVHTRYHLDTGRVDAQDLHILRGHTCTFCHGGLELGDENGPKVVNSEPFIVEIRKTYDRVHVPACKRQNSRCTRQRGKR